MKTQTANHSVKDDFPQKAYTVLLADDEAGIRRLLRRVCEQLEWNVHEAESGEEALRLMTEHPFQIFVLDINMPGPSGNELAKIILEREQAPAIMILTGYAELNDAVDAVHQGVCNYVQKDSINIRDLETLLLEAAAFHEKSIEEIQFKQKTEEEHQHTKLSRHQLKSIFDLSSDMMLVIEKNSGEIVECNPAACSQLGWDASNLLYKPVFSFLNRQDERSWPAFTQQLMNCHSLLEECEITTRNQDQIPVEIAFGYVNMDGSEFVSAVLRDISERKRHIEQLHTTLSGTIHLCALTAEKRDPYTAGHQKRVAQLSQAIAKQMELPQHQIEGVYMGGLIHDIGKVGIPVEILSKPGKLYKEEFDLIKLHPQLGYDIIKDIQFPWPVKEMVMQHHERLDGSGYPNGLHGDEIIIEAKIMGVADVVEAISSHRPYREALGIGKALTIIQEEKGTCFEPKIVDICRKLFESNSFAFEYL